MSSFIILTIVLIPTTLSQTYLHPVTCSNSSATSCECGLNEPCKLICKDTDHCQGTETSHYTLKCQPNQPCFVQCIGNSSCQHMLLDANDATNVSIVCKNGIDACSNSVFNCGSDICWIKCKSTAINACVDASVNTNYATSFDCRGSNCPESLLALQYPTNAPIILNTTAYHTNITTTNENKIGANNDYITIIIIVGASALGLAAICFGICCIFKRRKNKISTDDIEGGHNTNTRYSVSNNALAQASNKRQRPKSMQLTNYNHSTQVMRPKSEPIGAQPHVHYGNLNISYNPNMTQQTPQHTNTTQYYNTANIQPQNIQHNNPNVHKQQFASEENAQSPVSVDTDASLYEKQQQFAQEEMDKNNKSTMSVLSGNTDASLYVTQEKYALQELAELAEAKEVDTFEDTQAEQVGNIEVNERRMSAITTTTATTDASLYETQQKYLEAEMEEMNAKLKSVNGGKSASQRKSSRV